MADRYDGVVVGSGPNGLAAAVALAEQGWSVLVLEAEDRIGGGTRTAELTLPGFLHDVCSAVHPLGAGSPFFRRLPLEDHGLEWVQPELPLAHPLDDGSAGVLHRSVEDTAEGLGDDGPSYRRLVGRLVDDWRKLEPALLGPILRLPRHPLALLRFGLPALAPATVLARRTWSGERARGLFAGLAAHSILPLSRPLTSSFGLALAVLGHTAGWPFPRGGSQRIAEALAAHLGTLGGRVETGRRVTSLDELPAARAVLLDLTPRQVLEVAGDRLPAGYRRRLERFRYGPGVFKVDFALEGPVPWTAEACRRAGTVHVGGTLAEVAEAEAAVWRGEHHARPFVLVAQQSLFDPTRAPEGKHTLWAYCHVPHGSTVDVSARIEAQIERFAPGFRDLILARSALGPLQLQARNANLVGGDIGGGSHERLRLLFRPVVSLDPYATGRPGIFICSSSTPPGGGVHGLCGYHAARSVLRREARTHSR